MRKTLMPVAWPFSLALAVVLLTGCGGDVLTGSDSGSNNGSNNNATLSMTASSAAAPAALTAAAGGGAAITLPSGVTLTDFMIAIEEIEFEQAGEDMDDETDEPEFEGPFYVDLLSPTGILEQSLGGVSIPAGTYQGIEFTLHKSVESNTPPNLVDRSIYLAGTVILGGTVSFEIWHDANEEFFLTGSNGIVVEESGPASALVVDFNLDNILLGVDFTKATPEPDGVIRINPQSSVHAGLAEIIKNNLESAADFGEDEDGDGDLDEGEDTGDDGDSDEDGVDDDLE